VQKFRIIILRAFTNVNKNGIVVFLHSMKANKEGELRDSLILNLGVTWWSASHPGRFIPGEQPAYSLNRKVGLLQSRSGRIRVQGKLLPLPDSNLALSRP